MMKLIIWPIQVGLDGSGSPGAVLIETLEVNGGKHVAQALECNVRIAGFVLHVISMDVGNLQ
jgi:hypothetical protein